MYFFLLVGMLIMLLILFMFLSFKVYNVDKEKLISFECGFNSFFYPRSLFSIQFFKVLLIFLFFDTEIIIILPLVFVKFTFNMVSLILVMLILMILVLGLLVEIKEGSLEWLN